MLKFLGCLTAALLAGALAMPITAGAAPQRPNGGGGARRRAAYRRRRWRTAFRAAVPAAHRISPAMPAAHRISRAVSAAPPHFTARHFATPHFATHRNFVSHSSHIGTSHIRTATPNAVLHGTNSSTARVLQRGRHLHENGLANSNAVRGTSSLAAVPGTQGSRHLRRNGAAGITTQAARQGRFASRFAARAQSRSALALRSHRGAPRLAARPPRRLRGLVRAGVLALRLFRHFRLRVLARRL